MQNFIKIFFLLCIPLLTSCAKNKAAIVDRGSVIYDRNYSKNKYKGNAKSVDNSETIVVGKGDTIYSVAKKYGVTLRDLINVNSLTPPYVLKGGSKITLPSTQYYQVVAGDTLYSISRKYEMNVNDLIAINNLSKPYSVRAGERLKINNNPPSAKNQAPQPPTAYKKSDDQKTTEKSVAPEIAIAHPNNHFGWPIKGPIISTFGPKPGGLYNDGVNIKAKNGDNVKATEDGVVAYSGNELRGYGNLIIIKHSGGWISAYAHLDKAKVARGSKVKKGQNIATVGSTGNVKSSQLYFGLRKGREAVNPQTYL